MGSILSAINAISARKQSFHPNWGRERETNREFALSPHGVADPRRLDPLCSSLRPAAIRPAWAHQSGQVIGEDQFVRWQSPKETSVKERHLQTSQTTPNLQVKQPGKPPRFCGQMATLNAVLGRPAEEGFHGSWPLTGVQLKRIVDEDKTPYIGETPIMLQAHLGLSNQKLCRFLDELADDLRPEEDIPLLDRFLQEIHYPTRTLAVEGHLLQVKKVGEGSFGVVYKLTDGDTSYAFKVHKSYDKFQGYSNHSPYQEAATGAYLTGHNIIKDVVRFYAANPRVGWTLSEFIPSYTQPERAGLTLQQAGIVLGDNHFNNVISKVRVDLGGKVKQGDQHSSYSIYTLF